MENPLFEVEFPIGKGGFPASSMLVSLEGRSPVAVSLPCPLSRLGSPVRSAGHVSTSPRRSRRGISGAPNWM